MAFTPSIDIEVDVPAGDDFTTVKLDIIFDIDFEEQTFGPDRAYVAAWLVDKVNGVAVIDRHAVTKQYEQYICAETLEDDILKQEGYAW